MPMRVMPMGCRVARIIPWGQGQDQEQPKLIWKNVDHASREGRRYIDKCGKKVFRQDERLVLMRGCGTRCDKDCGNGGHEVSALHV